MTPRRKATYLQIMLSLHLLDEVFRLFYTASSYICLQVITSLSVLEL